MPAEKLIAANVCKSYPSEKGPLRVLESITFGVKEGEVVAIVGPSGCGKSTLLNIVAGFEMADEGTVTLDQVALSRPSARGILITQHGSVFPWLTVRQNLMFGLDGTARHERDRLADHYASLVGLTGFEGSYPHELSGGMLKRVELARALIVKPELLYMDEPFSALDALMSLRMRNELLRILSEERHTVVLVTHDVEEAIHLADRVLVLSSRPATLQAVFEVPFPHPRTLSRPAVQELRLSILQELGVY